MSSTSSSLIHDLKSQIDESIQAVCSDSSEYHDSIRRWSDVAVKSARAVIFPENAEHVKGIVRFARARKLDIAVKCGGHSTDGTSSSDGGIVIDLKKMNKVTVDAEYKTITSQGGALWADVNNVAANFGLAVVSGTVSHTGVGGVTLQGGYGFLTPQYGLVIDNLISASVIVADGRQMTACETENQDLFWAIRGAGYNFGVATEFTFRAHKQVDSVLAGSFVFSQEKMSAVIGILNSTLHVSDEKAASQCVLMKPSDSAVPVVVVVVFYNGTESEGRKFFEQLFELEAISCDIRMRSYPEANTMSDALAAPGGRKMLYGFSYATPLQPDFASRLLDKLVRKICAEPDLAESYIHFDFFSMSKVCQVSTTSTSFPSRAMLQHGVIAVKWTDPNKDNIAFKWGNEMKKRCEDELSLADKRLAMHVSNFLGYTEFSNATVSNMFGDNAKRLIEAKERYDPEGLFNKLNPIRTEGASQASGEPAYKKFLQDFFATIDTPNAGNWREFFTNDATLIFGKRKCKGISEITSCLESTWNKTSKSSHRIRHILQDGLDANSTMVVATVDYDLHGGEKVSLDCADHIRLVCGNEGTRIEYCQVYFASDMTLEK